MGRKKLSILIWLVAIAAVVLCIRLLFAPDTISVDSGCRQVMGTFAHVIAVAGDSKTADKCIEAAFDKLKYVDEIMSSYKVDSELSRLNRNAYNEPIQVGGDLFEVLSAAVEYSRMSGGAFDITIGPLADLWKQAEKLERRPTDEELASANSKVGWEKLILNAENKTVKFAVDGMRLDLGGIAKGYAIDLAVRAIQDEGALGGLVDVGGDIRCFGVAAGNKENWHLGLQDPEVEGELLRVLILNDMAVATSGDYRRFVLIDNEKYSHIINPATNFSAKNFSSVTIIAPTAVQADALATAVSVMAGEGGLRLIESLDNVEAILIGPDVGDEFILTKGAGQYIKE